LNVWWSVEEWREGWACVKRLIDNFAPIPGPFRLGACVSGMVVKREKDMAEVASLNKTQEIKN